METLHLTTLAMVVEYEGTRYFGFQRQSNRPSVQGELEKALRRMTGEEIKIKGASRTDAGVHAKGQVIAFTTRSRYSPEVFLRALNYYLPEDISIVASYKVPEGFDPRRAAQRREYRYSIYNSRTPSPLVRRYSHRIGEPLDIGAMQSAAQRLLGNHNFSPFAGAIKGRKSPRRTIYRADVSRKGDMVLVEAEANAFLPQQVRMTVGSLVRVGTHRMSVEDFGALLEAGVPGSGGPAVPSKGLCLIQIQYKGFPPS